MLSNIMILDDDPAFSKAAAELATMEGFQPHVARTLAQARDLSARCAMDLMLLDLHLPDGSGLDLLPDIDLTRHSRVAIVTGNPSIETAARAVAGPVTDYLIKPCEPYALISILRQSFAASQIGSSRSDEVVQPIPGVITRSEAMSAATMLARRIAPTPASVFLEGETGTGKEVFARALHEMSGLRGPFVALNCGAVPSELLASQLFGHERGSFTGAVQRHIGVFEQAAGGTLFLDEITEMPLELQVYLLRALETGAVRRVGATEETSTTVRIVTASNRDPMLAISEGRLREDLYYRLADVTITLPPLRQRGDDVVLLAKYFIEQHNKRYRLDKRLASSSIGALKAHAWPGNVRELRSAVQRAYLLTSGEQLSVSGSNRRPLQAAETEDSVTFTVGTTWAEIERVSLAKVLAYCGNDKTAAARMLGVSVRTIHNHLARLPEGQARAAAVRK